MTISERIENDIRKNKIMLYMKGSKDAPLCGFSARAVEILKSHQAPFQTFDILSDEEMRQGLKEFADWPTFPMLFVNGEFIGGCDIMTELNQNGELQKILTRQG